MFACERDLAFWHANQSYALSHMLCPISSNCGCCKQTLTESALTVSFSAASNEVYGYHVILSYGGSDVGELMTDKRKKTVHYELLYYISVCCISVFFDDLIVLLSFLHFLCPVHEFAHHPFNFRGPFIRLINPLFLSVTLPPLNSRALVVGVSPCLPLPLTHCSSHPPTPTPAHTHTHSPTHTAFPSRIIFHQFRDTFSHIDL